MYSDRVLEQLRDNSRWHNVLIRPYDKPSGTMNPEVIAKWWAGWPDFSVPESRIRSLVSKDAMQCLQSVPVEDINSWAKQEPWVPEPRADLALCQVHWANTMATSRGYQSFRNVIATIEGHCRTTMVRLEAQRISAVADGSSWMSMSVPMMGGLALVKKTTSEYITVPASGYISIVMDPGLDIIRVMNRSLSLPGMSEVFEAFTPLWNMVHSFRVTMARELYTVIWAKKVDELTKLMTLRYYATAFGLLGYYPLAIFDLESGKRESGLIGQTRIGWINDTKDGRPVLRTHTGNPIRGMTLTTTANDPTQVRGLSVNNPLIRKRD